MFSVTRPGEPANSGGLLHSEQPMQKRAARKTAATARPSFRREISMPLSPVFIDDDILTLNLMGKVAELLGQEALLGSTAGAGLEMAESENPDLILVDLRMPDRNGIEVVQALRSLPAIEKQLLQGEITLPASPHFSAKTLVEGIQ